MFAASKTNSVATGSAPDAQFNYVTILLHGDGTNGAQNNTFVDSSTNAFSITRNGNPTQGSFSPYGSNWSNYFNGSSYLDIASATASGSGSFCLEAWIYSTNVSAQQMVISNDTSGGMFFGMNVNAANKLGIGRTFVAIDNEVSYTWVNNTWYHIAVNRSGTSLQFFVNGTQVGSTASNSINYSTAGRKIGAETSAGSPFYGYISNVRCVNASVYTSTFTPSTTPLTAITSTTLLTCQSNRFVDNSSNAFAITATGTSVQRFNPFGASTAYSTSVIGGSGYFDGSDYLAISNGGGSALDMGTGDCTIEMWVYPDTQSTSFPSMFAPKNGWSTGTFYIRYQGSKFGIYWNSVGDPVINSTNSYAANAWYHVAFTRSGSTITLWVNGVSAGTATTSASLNLAIGGEVWLGNNTSAGCYYKGLLSNVRVVKGTAVYTAAFTPPTSPLTAISGTSLLTDFTNGAIYDNAMINNLETVGSAQISTSVVKYGTGSMYFNGTDSWLTFTGAKIGAGNFTIEAWVYLPSLKDADVIFDNRATTSSATGLAFALTVTGAPYVYTNNAVLFTSTQLVSTSTWTHVALVRSGSTLTIYVGGVSGGTATSSANFSDTNNAIGVALSFTSTTKFSGYIDDLRITNGYARYTTTFTPPTAAFPNTGPV
jgi:hypothetical protein